MLFSKAKAKEISYWSFRDFKEDSFNWDLQNRLSGESIEECTSFEKVFVDVLNKHAPLKEKIVCANDVRHITKTLRNAIVKRSYLEKVYFKKKTPDSLTKLKNQNNFCSRICKKEQKKIFGKS